MSGLTLRIVLLLVVLALAAAAGVALRRRDRRITTVDEGDVLTAADLTPGRAVASAGAAELGSRATFVQFSTPVCAGCRPAARVLDGLVSQDDGLRRIEIDATQRPDLARRFEIMRTPTVLVLDGGGRVVSRLSGIPTAEQALVAAGSSVAGPGRLNHRSSSPSNGS